MNCNFDPEIYSPDNLKQEDRRILEALLTAQETVFDKSVVKKYVSECFSGKETMQLVTELLTPFMEYLLGQMDYSINDFMIDTIDGYEDEKISVPKGDTPDEN